MAEQHTDTEERPRYYARRERGTWCFGTSNQFVSLDGLRPNTRMWLKFVHTYGVTPAHVLSVGSWEPVPIPAAERGGAR